MDRTEQAKRLAANKLLPELLDELEAAQISGWKAAATVEAREAAWHLARAITKVRHHVETSTRRISRGGDES